MLHNVFEYCQTSPTFLTWKISTSRKIKIGDSVGGINKTTGYARVRFDGQFYLAHRVIWEIHYGPLLEGQYIDHINSIRSDNRIENLRIASMTQNNQNKSKRLNCKSRYKGVSWHTQCKKWRAELWDNKTRIYLGLFDSEEQAATAYDEKALEIFGEFAKPNIKEC